MKKIKASIDFLLVLCLVCFLLSGCSGFFTNIEIGASERKIDLSTVENELVIRKPGTYILSGNLEGGITVEVGSDNDVEIILNGVNVHNENFAAIYVKSCNKMSITLAENSKNYLADSNEYTQVDDNNVSSCIFSKSDLFFSGKGELFVNSEENGIVSKDSLVINGGVYSVISRKKGICGKDEVIVNGGFITINSQKDAISSTNIDDVNRGNVCISGGTINIATTNDGISAINNLFISSGNVKVETYRNTEEKSNKGLKSDGKIEISGGSLDLKCYGDCVSGKDTVLISGGDVKLYSEDDAVHSDKDLIISGGNLVVLTSDEALQGKDIKLLGGKIELHAQDDGINASDPSDSSMGWGKGPSTDASLLIKGGEIKIVAGGDGVDSNGSIRVEGGTTVIDGPASSSDTAFDYATIGEICGGTLFAIGSADEAVPVSDTSTQISFIIDLKKTYAAGSDIIIANCNKTLFEHTSSKQFSCVLFSCPDLKLNDVVELRINGDVREIKLVSLIVDEM